MLWIKFLPFLGWALPFVPPRLAIRGMAPPHLERHVFVCTHQRPAGDGRGACGHKGADEVVDAFKAQLHARGTRGRLKVNATGCMDQCQHGTTVVVYPEQVWYGAVTAADVDEIIEMHLLGGAPVERLRLK